MRVGMNGSAAICLRGPLALSRLCAPDIARCCRGMVDSMVDGMVDSPDHSTVAGMVDALSTM